MQVSAAQLIKNKHAYLFPEFCRLSLLVHGLFHSLYLEINQN